MTGVVATVGLAGSMVVAAAACSALSPGAADDLSAWRPTPIRPNAALAVAASTNEWCRSTSTLLDATLPPPLPAMEVVLQDQRTGRTAAFVVRAPGYVGSCVVSPGGHSFGAVQAPVAPVLDEGVTIDGEASALIGSSSASWAWGRVDPWVRSVTIDLAPALHVADDDTRVVKASVGGGYWIGWWPDPGVAVLINGRDASGTVVETRTRSDDGWVRR